MKILKDDYMNECLYQTIEKEHMESNVKETIDAKEWNEFCKHFIDSFAEEVSELAIAYWIERNDNGFEYSVGDEQ
jgi:hypothetical protein